MSLEQSSDAERELQATVHALEEQMFRDDLHPTKSQLMHGDDGYSYFRPSHHFYSGLIDSEDLEAMRSNTTRTLTVGAGPAYLERVLVELGVPVENLVIADNNNDFAPFDSNVRKEIFDMHHPWPDMGTFDFVLFPESLTISVVDKNFQEPQLLQMIKSDTYPGVYSLAYDADQLESILLTNALSEAYDTLRSDGIIRANGVMRDIHTIGLVHRDLNRNNRPHSIEYRRMFLEIQKTSTHQVDDLLKEFGELYSHLLQNHE